jgi:hypothetical protein
MGELQAQKQSMYLIQQDRASHLMRNRSLEEKINGHEVMLGKLVDSNARLVFIINEKLTMTFTAEDKAGNVNQIMARMDGLQRAIGEVERVTGECAKRLEGVSELTDGHKLLYLKKCCSRMNQVASMK